MAVPEKNQLRVVGVKIIASRACDRGLRVQRAAGLDCRARAQVAELKTGFHEAARHHVAGPAIVGLPWIKRLADFDFSFQPSIDRTLIEELATGRFLHDGRNVVLLGPPGVGKTHLAIGLGLVAAETGHRITFLSALELARRMNTAFAQNRLPHYLKTLTTPRLLIIDEVGYLGLDAQQASMLFQVICSRYEKQAATIITSNKPFSEWGHVFAGDPVMASAALDRLLHRATVVNIKGDSYRLKEKRQAGLFSGAAALEPTKGGATTKTK